MASSDHRKQYTKDWNVRNPTHRRMYALKLHGLTVEEYDQLWANQLGLCAICCKAETRIHKTGTAHQLSVDHDHACCPGKKSCGKCVRGLLCDSCNQGHFHEDPILLRAAAEYFESWTHARAI